MRRRPSGTPISTLFASICGLLISFNLGFFPQFAAAQSVSSPPGLCVYNGRLMFDGKPYRGVGANYFDVFLRVLHDPTNFTSLHGLAELHAAGIPFVRFALAYGQGDYQIYLTNPPAYFQRLDAVVHSAESNHVGLIPSFFWTFDFPQALGESNHAWGDPHSQTWKKMQRFVTETVNRYKNSPAIWGWEFGNEGNLLVDLPLANNPQPMASADQLAAMREFAQAVRRCDTWRPIFSGNSCPRPSAWHNSHENNWEADSHDQSLAILARDNPFPLNTVTVHYYCYADARGQQDVTAWTTNRMVLLQSLSQFAHQQGRPLCVEEWGVNTGTNASSDLPSLNRKLLDDLQAAGIDLAAFWVFDLDNQEATWNVTTHNSRAYLLRVVSDANRQWNKSALVRNK